MLSSNSEHTAVVCSTVQGGACGDRVRVAVVEQDLIVQLYAAPEVRREGHSGE